jgi:hypothetical protein
MDGGPALADGCAELPDSQAAHVAQLGDAFAEDLTKGNLRR